MSSSGKFLTLPNQLTYLRLALTPVFVAAIFWNPEKKYVLYAKSTALVIACLFELTDIMDGWIARRFNQTSDMGKLLDPMADRISRFTVFLCFLKLGWANIWMILLIFWRESVIETLRGIAAQRGVAMGAKASGKIKAIIQGICIITILTLDLIGYLLDDRAGNFLDTTHALMWVVTITTIWSGLDYLWRGRKLFTQLS